MASMPFVAFSQAIEEVTVTATRKVESLQDIPLSVQALDAEALESQHIETCLLYTSPSPRDNKASRMPSSA